MTPFEIIQNLTIFGIAHAVLITVITEGVKRLFSALTNKDLAKPAKVLLPLGLGVSALFAAPAVVRALALTTVVCAVPEKCVYETLWVCALWWGGVSFGAIGIYHITLLLWVDLVQGAKSKIKKWSET